MFDARKVVFIGVINKFFVANRLKEYAKLMGWNYDGMSVHPPCFKKAVQLTASVDLRNNRPSRNG